MWYDASLTWSERSQLVNLCQSGEHTPSSLPSDWRISQSNAHFQVQHQLCHIKCNATAPQRPKMLILCHHFRSAIL